MCPCQWNGTVVVVVVVVVEAVVTVVVVVRSNIVNDRSEYEKGVTLNRYNVIQ